MDASDDGRKLTADQKRSVLMLALTALAIGFDPVKLLSDAIGAERQYNAVQARGGVDELVRLLPDLNANLLAAPGLRGWIAVMRLTIREDPAHASSIVGNHLNRILDALKPARRRRGTRPRTRAQRQSDDFLVKFRDQVRALMLANVKNARQKALRQVTQRDVSPADPPPLPYIDNATNWYGRRVAPFSEKLVAVVNDLLRIEDRCFHPQVFWHAAAWTFEAENGRAPNQDEDALKWIRGVDARRRQRRLRDTTRTK